MPLPEALEPESVGGTQGLGLTNLNAQTKPIAMKTPLSNQIVAPLAGRRVLRRRCSLVCQVRGAVRDRALVVKLQQDLKKNNLSEAVAFFKVKKAKSPACPQPIKTLRQAQPALCRALKNPRCSATPLDETSVFLKAGSSSKYLISRLAFRWMASVLDRLGRSCACRTSPFRSCDMTTRR
eukprot:9467298-Pyramimonas_sp.AAC.1